jgi:hypothetical protein
LWFGGVSEQILDQIANASTFYDNSVEYYEDCSNLSKYNLSIHAAYAMWEAIENAKSIFETTRPILQVVLIYIASVATIMVFTMGLYHVKHRRVI